MSLVELAQLLRMQYQESSIYYITTNRSNFERAAYIKNGFTDAFILPFDSSTLESSFQDDISKASKGPFDLLDSYSVEIRGVLKNQLSAERSGFANPYTLAYLNPKTKEPLYLRCVPTLIMPNKANVPVYTSTYITEMHEDCALNYYNHCRTLLGVVHER